MTAVSGFFGGLPRRFAGPWRASMARFSLSRSAIRSVMICSVGIERIVACWINPDRFPISVAFSVGLTPCFFRWPKSAFRLPAQVSS